MSMPKVDMKKIICNLPSNVSAEETKVVNLVIKKNGEIRAIKPKVTDDPVTGKAAYVWRMVCFMVSPKPAHHCMPVCAIFDLPAYLNTKHVLNKWSTSLAHKMAKNLDVLVDVIVDSVDKTEWHGVHRWAKVFKKTLDNT